MTKLVLLLNTQMRGAGEIYEVEEFTPERVRERDDGFYMGKGQGGSLFTNCLQVERFCLAVQGMEGGKGYAYFLFSFSLFVFLYYLKTGFIVDREQEKKLRPTLSIYCQSNIIYGI